MTQKNPKNQKTTAPTAPIKGSREERNFINFEIRAFQTEAGAEELYVEGYAATFQPTVMFEYNGVKYMEQIDALAFSEADMTDIIFNYNHSGKVMARTRNKTLIWSVDSNGLYIKARLDGTEEGRKMYEEIKGGYIDRMSFAFVVSEDSMDRDTHTRTVRKIKKVYDVSAVDIPAYESTSISARSYFEAVAEEERKTQERVELQKRKLKLLCSLGGI